MPKLASRPCAHRGCPEVVRGRGVRFCQRHLQEHRRQQDENRGTASARGYGPRWRERRDRYLAEHPWCQRCGKRRPVLVHHILPKRDGGSDEPVNLLALCNLCHAQVHAEAEGLFRRLSN